MLCGRPVGVPTALRGTMSFVRLWNKGQSLFQYFLVVSFHQDAKVINLILCVPRHSQDFL